MTPATNRSRWLLVAFSWLLLSLASAVASAQVAARESPQRGSSTLLQDARGVAELKDWFNRERGHARLVLLLSPT